MNKNERKYVLNEIRKVQKIVKDSDDFSSHLVVGIEQDENGYPQSSLTMSLGKPMEMIGMVDTLISQLKDIRKDVLESLKEPKNQKRQIDDKTFDKMIDSLPDSIAEKVRDFKKRMDEAVDSGDDDKLKALRVEIESMKNPFSKMNPDNDDDDETPGFNINDFKGGMA